MWLLRVYSVPCALNKAKTGRYGGEWWISPCSSCSLVLLDTMAWCSQLIFQPALGHPPLLHCASIPSAHIFLRTVFPRKVWQGRLRAIFTMWISLTSSHIDAIRNYFQDLSILPPKWCMNNLKKLLWVIILKWQFWVFLIQAQPWEAGTQWVLYELADLICNRLQGILLLSVYLFEVTFVLSIFLIKQSWKVTFGNVCC